MNSLLCIVIRPARGKADGPLTQSLAGFLQTPDCLLFFSAHTIILQHAGVLPHIVALDLKSGLWGDCIKHEVIVAVRTVFVALLKFLDILAKALFAFFAGEDHF